MEINKFLLTYTSMGLGQSLFGGFFFQKFLINVVDVSVGPIYLFFSVAFGFLCWYVQRRLTIIF